MCLASRMSYMTSCSKYNSIRNINYVSVLRRREIWAKHFCTDKTEKSGNPTTAAGKHTVTEGTDPDDSVTSNAATNRKTVSNRQQYEQFEEQVQKQNSLNSVANPVSSPRTQRHSPGMKGDIVYKTPPSLFDMAVNESDVLEGQQQQQSNPEFYRRRMESGWGPAASKKTFRAYQDASTPSQVGIKNDWNLPPFVSENRRPIYEPTYYAGFACLMCCAFVLGFSFLKKDPDPDTMETLIAKSWIAEGKGNLAEAEELLHEALKLAQDQKHQEGITYIYDQMANLSMRHGNLTKAEGLFQETLKRMISSGTAQDDSAVIEISLKLARMYDRMRRYTDSEQGFNWCITTTEKKLEQTKDKETRQNLLSLLGMCLDSYARSLATHGRLDESTKMYKRALVICQKDLEVDGVPHPQTVVLMNDLGTVYDLGGRYTEAIETIQQAIVIAEQRSPQDLPSVLCNLASVKMHTEEFEEAETHYKKALTLAEKQGDAATILEIKNSIAQLQTNVVIKKEKLKEQKTKAQKS
ncbi:tetratricopeptide repeat protein 19, mitochondrial-like [Asterias amurensis]|uniref:tetratricopeptide repeat protein 19, mitochondrial-like n=1 Tax=Asterias amurensis TaxID=7602 RepID=UPI003AB516DC